MHHPQHPVLLDEMNNVNEHFYLTSVNEVDVCGRLTLLVEKLSGTEVDWLQLMDDGVVELFRPAPEEFDFLEHFTMSLGNDLISQVNGKL